MVESASARLEPSMGSTSVSAAPAGPAAGSHEAQNPRPGLDQLSRIEDKTARIEEKYARSEALLQRVGSAIEAATNRMQEVASQAELTALRSEISMISAQVRRLPGKTALVSVAIVTSLLTAAIVLVLLRFGI